MKQEIKRIAGWDIPVFTVDTAIIGSGCAGLNAADCLYDNGCRDILLVTEGWYMGTSRNTGSDKQTYYKLSLSGEDADSVRLMAQDLFSGGAMDGDHALLEPLDQKLCDRISINTAKLADIGAEAGCQVKVSYMGGIMESYPAQVRAIKWELVKADPALP